ncbi:ComEA family DNA-binding protein [Labedaea rhizosphaerae]|uniref:Competence protein ComEA n=1 Tax=Labedaea rhizosphaerae TaxID=598644 RepID=A0A4V3CZ13_LABRH|nr:ComEA family DNA-binding protein [Labedaea rhizosphaerae]TDP96308.1 competence protein ComEA [Labedaea rhizosphaerae]
MFDSTRQLLADRSSAAARLRALANRADPRRPDDELPDDQTWTEEPGAPPPVRGYVHGGHGRRWLVIGLAAVVLLAAGIGIAVASGGPVAEPVSDLPAAANTPTAAPTVRSAAVRPSTASTPRIVVSVRGKVRHPGLITLAPGARVADAIKACGGLRHGADPGALNLARKLADGEQIYVAIPVPPGADVAVAPSADGDAPGQSKVDINTASAEKLDTLPGIGEVTAQRIVQWRQQHGRFASVDQLQQVPGIGDAKLASLRDLVVAG